MIRKARESAMKYWMPLALLVCIAVALAAGCVSSHAVSSTSASVPADYAYSSEKATLSGSGVARIAGDQIPSPAAPNSVNYGKGADIKIIKTADVTIETSNITGAVGVLAGIATNAGGYVSSSYTGTSYYTRLSGSVVLRVPASQFDNVLSGVKAIGTVKSVSTQSQDVTSEYVDTEAKINAYKNQLAQYNVIMKNATDTKDVLAVQQQIDTVQSELDRATGQMKYLSNRIDYATISVSLQEPEPVGGSGSHDFVAAINDGIAGFFGVIDGIIVLIITIIPLIVIGGAAYAGYRYYRKGHPRAPAKGPEKKE